MVGHIKGSRPVNPGKLTLVERGKERGNTSLYFDGWLSAGMIALKMQSQFD